MENSNSLTFSRHLTYLELLPSAADAGARRERVEKSFIGCSTNKSAALPDRRALLVAAMAHIRVEKLDTAEQVRTFLSSDRIYAAYAIGTLETTNTAANTVLVARNDHFPLSLFLLSQPIETAPTLFLMGDPSGLEEVFLHPLASVYFAWASARDEHMTCVRRYWRVEDPESMLRMVTTADTFRPDAMVGDQEVKPLSLDDQQTLVHTYEMAFGGAPASMRLLERGPYFGVWHRRQLVSVAGTHFHAKQARLAAVGNVWTAPSFRNRRLATATVGAVTRELLKTCDDVVLNVREDNAPARRVYERLGYRVHCRYWQTRVRWRG